MESSNSTPMSATTWHIVWQAVDGRDLLGHPELIDRIRMRVVQAHRSPDRVLMHHLVMPTELHLLSRLTSGTSPGDIARAISSIVARWVRQAHGMPGIVFSGGYRAYPIESEEAARNELRMLAWRPVVLGLCRAPTHYSHSTLRATLGLRRAMGFDALAPLRLFSDSVPEARKALRGRIAMRPDAIELRQWELTRGMVLAPGNAGTFSPTTRHIHGLAAALVAAAQPQAIDGALGLLERWVLLKLDCRDGEKLAALCSPAGARGRALVASLAVRLNLCSAASVARHFKRAKATLSERMAACRHEPEDQAILALPLARIVAEAIGLRNGPSPGHR